MSAQPTALKCSWGTLQQQLQQAMGKISDGRSGFPTSLNLSLLGAGGRLP